MATEVKVMNVHPKEEEHTIRVFQSFGWVLRGNQSVYSRDSHLENHVGTLYSVTKTTNYVKLTFERDGSQLKNYSQLRQLENEYYSIPIPKKPKAPSAGAWFLCYCMALMVFLTASLFRGYAIEFAGLVLIGLVTYLLLKNKKDLKNWKAAYEDGWNRREQVRRKALPYL